MGGQGQEHDGLVLRIQATHRHQQLQRDNTMDAHTGKHGRLRTAKKQELHPTTVRKAVCRQGLYKAGSFRPPPFFLGGGDGIH